MTHNERRHELQENELAQFLARINKSIDPYSKPIGIGVAAALIGMLGWGFYSSVQSDRRSDATLQLIDASVTGDADRLATVAATYPGTSAAAWSRLYQGSSKMGVGISALFTSRDEAEELLSEAETAYQEAMKLSDDEIIQSRAQFGMARIAESLGNTEDAIAKYEAAMAVGESDAMIAEAKQRIELLTSNKGKEFLTWFGEQDFSPADPSMPPSLPGAGTLPDLPDLDLPDLDLPEDGKADDGTDASESDGDQEAMKLTPAEKDASTADEASEEPKPDAGKPDAEKKAATDEQPAKAENAAAEAKPEAEPRPADDSK